MTTYDYIEFDGFSYQGFQNGNRTTKPTIHELYSKTASEYIEEDIILRLMGPDITISDINCSKHLRIEPYFLRTSTMTLGDLDVGKDLKSIGESDSIHITSRTPVNVTGNVKVHTDHLNVGIKINGPEKLVFSGNGKVTQIMLYSNLREQEAIDASGQFYATWNDTADSSGILSTWNYQNTVYGGVINEFNNADASLNNASTNGGSKSLQDEFDDATTALATATSRLNDKDMSSNYFTALGNLMSATNAFDDANSNYNEALNLQSSLETERDARETAKTNAGTALAVSQANYEEAAAAGEITADISSNYHTDLLAFNNASANFTETDASLNLANEALTAQTHGANSDKTLEQVFNDASGTLNAVDENEKTLLNLVDEAFAVYNPHKAAVAAAAGNDNSVYFEDVSNNYHTEVATALAHDASFNVTDLSGIYHTAKKAFEDASGVHSTSVTALEQEKTDISNNYLGGTFTDLQTEYNTRKTASDDADAALTDDISGAYHTAKQEFEDATTNLTTGQSTLNNLEAAKNTAQSLLGEYSTAAEQAARTADLANATNAYNDQYAVVNGDNSTVSEADSLVGLKTAKEAAYKTTAYGSTGVSIKDHYDNLNDTIANANNALNTETVDASGNKWDKDNASHSIATVYGEYLTKQGDVETKLGEKTTAEAAYTGRTGLVDSFDALIGSKLVDVYDAFALNFTNADNTLNADTVDESGTVTKESLATRHAELLNAFNTAQSNADASGAYHAAKQEYESELPNVALLETRMREALIHEMVLSIDSSKGGISLFESTSPNTPIANNALYQRYVIDLSSFAQSTTGKADAVQFENYDLTDSIDFPIRLTIGDDVNIGNTTFTEGLTFVHETVDAEKTVKLKACDIASSNATVDLINVVNNYITAFNTYDKLTNNKRLVLDMTSNDNKITLATNQHFLLRTDTDAENLALAVEAWTQKQTFNNYWQSTN